MAYYGTIVGTKSITEHLQGRMSTHYTEYIDYPAYEGTYVATPTSSKQYFPTADKRMTQNFAVNKTPFLKVSNIQGGYTVTIL